VTRGDFSSRAAAAGQGQPWGNRWATRCLRVWWCVWWGGQAGPQSGLRRNTNSKTATTSIRLLLRHLRRTPSAHPPSHQRVISVPLAHRIAVCHLNRPTQCTCAPLARSPAQASSASVPAPAPAPSRSNCTTCPLRASPFTLAPSPPSACNPFPRLTRPARRPTEGDAPLPHVRMPGALPLLLQARSP
jgi:hypothetical protein